MATIDDNRARLLAGQAARLRDDARDAAELMRRGEIESASAVAERSVSYANAIWHELDLLTRPPVEPRVKGKSRRR